MSDRAALLALAERCEKATGPNRRLGAEIEIAAKGFPERAYQQRNAMRPKGSPELDRLEWATEWFGPGPTASIDAAMTLVPEEWLVMTLSQLAGDGMAFAELVNPFRSLSETAIGKEMHCALTAAALRAQAHLTEDERHG